MDLYPPSRYSTTTVLGGTAPDISKGSSDPEKTWAVNNISRLSTTMDSSNRVDVGANDLQSSKTTDNKADGKGPASQSTFLTKLYALLERPENQHMIRWDKAGEHIIVERPEQLALHVLPSIYRQSRFASFSRQLNIYGFMRKVNLRNVDPAIDDPDASTWSHPTLNRHSSPEVVANFKRRVPPRLPKPRKRDSNDNLHIPPPRSAHTVPSSMPPVGRARGFSAPGAYGALPQHHAGAWSNGGGGGYGQRPALPPLDVPGHGQYAPQHISPADEIPFAYTANSYQTPSFAEQGSWNFSSSNPSSHNSSLSSLLNPSSAGNGYSRPTPTINTSFNSSSFSSMPMEHSSSSLSPDSHSRPNTGYSMASVSSMGGYDDHMEYHSNSRPTSSHHRTMTPPRPSSSKGPYGDTLSIRRTRRHSQALGPYPSPHPQYTDQRPSTSPQPGYHGHSGSLARPRSMIQLPSMENQYSFSPQPDFAYGSAQMDYRPSTGNGRPSTGTSATSSSHANTPPIAADGFVSSPDVRRYESPPFGYTMGNMSEHMQTGYTKELH